MACVIVSAKSAEDMTLIGRERHPGVGSAPDLAVRKCGICPDIGYDDGKSRGNDILTE
jgi:hypothetical protein